jgi:hypothetical protein
MAGRVSAAAVGGAGAAAGCDAGFGAGFSVLPHWHKNNMVATKKILSI